MDPFDQQTSSLGSVGTSQTKAGDVWWVAGGMSLEVKLIWNIEEKHLELEASCDQNKTGATYSWFLEERCFKRWFGLVVEVSCCRATRHGGMEWDKTWVVFCTKFKSCIKKSCSILQFSGVLGLPETWRNWHETDMFLLDSGSSAAPFARALETNRTMGRSALHVVVLPDFLHT